MNRYSEEGRWAAFFDINENNNEEFLHFAEIMKGLRIPFNTPFIESEVNEIVDNKYSVNSYIKFRKTVDDFTLNQGPVFGLPVLSPGMWDRILFSLQRSSNNNNNNNNTADDWFNLGGTRNVNK